MVMLYRSDSLVNDVCSTQGTKVYLEGEELQDVTSFHHDTGSKWVLELLGDHVMDFYKLRFERKSLRFKLPNKSTHGYLVEIEMATPVLFTDDVVRTHVSLDMVAMETPKEF